MSLLDGHPKPLVSVIIPTHNRAGLLQDALKSVRTQEGTGHQFVTEVIVVDDASSDATPEVATRFPDVKYIRLSPNRGLPAARNAGIRASTGKYVALLDDDDLWFPHKLRVQVPALEAHPEAGAVYSQCIVRFGTREWTEPDPYFAPSGLVFRSLLQMNFIGNTLGILMRRDVFAKAGYFDEGLPYSEDYDMWLRLAFHFPLVFVPGPVAIYQLALQGMFVTAIVDGGHAACLRSVLERALAMLPDTTAHVDIKEEARAYLEFQLADNLAMVGRPELMQPHYLAGLRTYPWVARAPRIRNSIASHVRHLATASESPLATARVLCRELSDAAGERGLRARVWARPLIAAAWAEVAVGLAFGPRANARAAGSAAARAVLQNPSVLRRKILLALMLRAIMGCTARRGSGSRGPQAKGTLTG
jgi:glycosyltransferase involved in cell wall biosynthesis